MDLLSTLQIALRALLRNKMRSILTVLGITIGIAAVICVVAIGKAGQARVEQQLNNLGDIAGRAGSAIAGKARASVWNRSNLQSENLAAVCRRRP